LLPFLSPFICVFLSFSFSFSFLHYIPLYFFPLTSLSLEFMNIQRILCVHNLFNRQ
jgi:hypothetical protein